jgi:transposase
MRVEERLAELEAENAVLREQVSQLQGRVAELEGRLVKDSHNSSKPPSSDGLGRKRSGQRPASEKKSGGQTGHVGSRLAMAEQPDRMVVHGPSECVHCHLLLEGVVSQVIERRQVHDLPVWRVQVTEHQVEEVMCPRCQQASRGTFPVEVSAPVQYGPGVRALAVYLHQYQLVPMQRTCELLSDLCGCELSEGTLLSWVELAAERLVASMEQIKQGVLASRLQHADETGVHLGGKLRLPAREQYTLSHASGLAPEARTRGIRSHRHLAALPGALHARSVGEL